MKEKLDPNKIFTLFLMLLVACSAIPKMQHKHTEHCRHCVRNGHMDHSCEKVCLQKRRELAYRKAPQTNWPLGWTACNKCLHWQNQARACYSTKCFSRCSAVEARRGVPVSFLQRMEVLNKPCE
jgi:hypothetical protein